MSYLVETKGYKGFAGVVTERQSPSAPRGPPSSVESTPVLAQREIGVHEKCTKVHKSDEKGTRRRKERCKTKPKVLEILIEVGALFGAG